MTLTLSGGDGAYNIVNNSGSGTVNNLGGNMYSITGLTVGVDANLLINDGNACPFNFSQLAPDCNCPVLAPPTAPQVTFDLCSGDPFPTITANAPAGSQTYWYDVSTGGIPLAGPSNSFMTTMAGTYYAETEQDGTGCASSSRTAITVTLNADPVLSLAFPPNCSADFLTYDVTVTASNGFGTYSIALPGSGSVSNLGPDSFSITGIAIGESPVVTVSDGNGCLSDLPITAPVCACDPIAAPSAATVTYETCVGAAFPTITANAPAGNETYWYDAAVGGMPLAGPSNTYMTNMAGTYYAESAHPTNGCTSTTRTEITVVENALPTLAIIDVPFCDPSLTTYSVTVQGVAGTGPYTINNPTVGLLTANADGTFTISGIPIADSPMLGVTDAKTCTGSMQIMAPMCMCPDPIPDSPLETQEVCAGDPFTALTAVAPAGFETFWFNEMGVEVAGPTNSFMPSAGSYYASFIEINSSCPSGGIPFEVTENPNPSVMISVVPACSADLSTYSLSVQVSGGDGNFTVSNGNIGTITDMTAGVYEITGIPTGTDFDVTVVDGNLCDGTVAVISPICDCPTLTVPSDGGNPVFDICAGDALPLLSATVAAGLEVNWYDLPVGGTFLFNGNDYDPVGGAGTYYAETFDPTSLCTSATRTAIELNVNPIPADPLTAAVVEFCLNETGTQLMAMGNGIQWWDDFTAANSIPAPTPNTASVGVTTYYVSSTELGCESTRIPVDVQINALPLIVVDQTICSGDLSTWTADFTVSGGLAPYTFATSQGGPIGPGPVISVENLDLTQSLEVTVSDQSSCEFIISIPAKDCNCPTVLAPVSDGDLIICADDAFPSLSVTADPAYAVNWFDVAVGGTSLISGATYMPDAAGIYYAEALEVATGCTSIRTPVQLTVTALPAEPTVQNLTYCQDETAAELSAVGAGLTWFSADMDGTEISVPTPATDAVGQVSFWVSATENSCESARTELIVDITAAPTLASSGSACSADLTTWSVTLEVTDGTAPYDLPVVNNGVVTDMTGGIYEISGLSLAMALEVTVSDMSSCSSDVTIDAPADCSCPDVNEPVPATLVYDLCEGDAWPELSAIGEAGLELNWFDDPAGAPLILNSPSYTVDAAGTYYVEALNTTTDCVSDKIAIDVNVMPLPAAPMTNSIELCVGETEDLADYDVDVIWYDSNDPAAVPLAAPPVVDGDVSTGTSIFYASVMNGNCESLRTMVDVTVFAKPELMIIDGPTCDPALTSYSITVQATGGDGNYSLVTSEGTVTDGLPGIYTIDQIASGVNTFTATVSDDHCDSDELSVIDWNCDCPVVADAVGYTTQICANQMVPELTADVEAGLSANWYDAPGGALLMEGSLTYTPGDTGTVYVVAVDPATDCLSPTAVAVTVDLAASLSPSFAVADSTICIGDIASTYSLLTPYDSYDWMVMGGTITDGGTPADDFVSVLWDVAGTGSVNVDVTAAGCTGSKFQNIVVSDLPTISFMAPNDNLCGASTETYTLGQSFDSYQWLLTGGTVIAGGGAADNTITVEWDSNPAAAMIEITGTDAQSCSSYLQLPITLNAAPVATASPSDVTVCTGGSVQIVLSGAGPGGSYLMNDGLGGQEIIAAMDSVLTLTPDADVNYEIIAMNAQSCSDTVMATVAISNSLTITADLNATFACAGGDSVILTPSGAVNYSLAPAGTWAQAPDGTFHILPSATTDYTMIGDDGSGCSDTTMFTIDVAPAVDISLAPTIVVGACETVNMPLIINNATGTENFEWSTADGISDSTLIAPGIEGGSMTGIVNYTVTVSDGLLCPAIATIAVEFIAPQTLSVNVGDTVSVCPGASATVQASGADSYSWGGGSFELTDDLSQVQLNPETSTEYMLIGSDAQGCEDTLFVFVEISNDLDATVSTTQVICEGLGVELEATGGTIYEWSPGIGLNDSTIANPIASPEVSTIYQVTISNGAGCFGIETVEVDVELNPTASIAIPEAFICPEESVNISGVLADNYNNLQWSGGAGTFSDVNALEPSYTPGPGELGLVSLELTVSNLCETLNLSFDVNIDENGLNLQPIILDPVCEGETITLTCNDNGGNTDCNWSGGNGVFDSTNGSTVEYTPAETGAFELFLDASNSCSSQNLSIAAEVLPAGLIDAGDDVSISMGEAIDLSVVSDGIGNTSWFVSGDNSIVGGESICDSCSSVTVSPVTNTTYLINSDNICIESTTVTVFVTPRAGKPRIPTAFSPNGDGNNDFYRPVIPPGFEMHSFSIYNRYGQQMMQIVEDDGIGWDGTFNGEPQEMGTYVFEFQYRDMIEPNVIIPVLGNVTLIR